MARRLFSMYIVHAHNSIGVINCQRRSVVNRSHLLGTRWIGIDFRIREDSCTIEAVLCLAVVPLSGFVIALILSCLVLSADSFGLWTEGFCLEYGSSAGLFQWLVNETFSMSDNLWATGRPRSTGRKVMTGRRVGMKRGSLSLWSINTREV